MCTPALGGASGREPVTAAPRSFAGGRHGAAINEYHRTRGTGPYAGLDPSGKKKKKRGYTSRSTESTGSLRINQT